MAENDKLGNIEKYFIASCAAMNGSALDLEGNTVDLKDCGIDSKKILTLGEYIANKRQKERGEEASDEIAALKDDPKLERTFVLPVTLPNGQEIEVIVNEKGQDIACMYKDQDGNQNTFQLTPRMKKQIQEAIPEELEQIVGEKVLKEIREDYLPENVDELAENISNDELVPTKNQVLRKVNEKNGAKEEKKTIKEQEKKENELPPETRDIIAKICSENGLDITALKEVMEVPPQAISDNLEGTGFKDNDGRITCLRFRDGEKLQGRVVMVQGSKVVDNRTYDDYMNDYMNEHRGEKRVDSPEDDHDKLTYTDLDGNTTTCEITKEPRDLTCSQKEELQEKMYELDMKTDQIRSSNMSLEDKAKAFASVNQERLDAFKEYGIEVPLVEDEIEADIEIAKETESTEQENNKELDDGVDPRDTRNGGDPKRA